MQVLKAWEYEAVRWRRVRSRATNPDFTRVVAGIKKRLRDILYQDSPSDGLRLCTKAEIDGGAADNQGCGFDTLMTWVSDECESGTRRQDGSVPPLIWSGLAA